MQGTTVILDFVDFCHFFVILVGEDDFTSASSLTKNLASLDFPYFLPSNCLDPS